MQDLVGYAVVIAGIAAISMANDKGYLRGGKADKYKRSDFNKRQLSKGTVVEMEHTYNREIAEEIAMDHLREDPNYYKELERMERKLKRSRKSKK